MIRFSSPVNLKKDHEENIWAIVTLFLCDPKMSDKSRVRSHQPFLVVVGTLMEDEGHGGVPGGLQHPVPQPPLVRAVVPLGQVAGAVGVFWGRPHLFPVNAPPTSEPGETMETCRNRTS